MTLAIAEIKNDKNISVNECFTPAFIFPSESFPITSPVKKPWTKIIYKNAFEIASWLTTSPSPPPKPPTPKAPIVVFKSPNPETIGII